MVTMSIAHVSHMLRMHATLMEHGLLHPADWARRKYI